MFKFLLRPICWWFGHVTESEPHHCITLFPDGTRIDDRNHVDKYAYCQRCGEMSTGFAIRQSERGVG